MFESIMNFLVALCLLAGAVSFFYLSVKHGFSFSESYSYYTEIDFSKRESEVEFKKTQMDLIHSGVKTLFYLGITILFWVTLISN